MTEYWTKSKGSSLKTGESSSGMEPSLMRITDTPRRPPGRKEYEVVTDREEEEGMEASEKAMLKEITKPNADAEAQGW